MPRPALPRDQELQLILVTQAQIAQATTEVEGQAVTIRGGGTLPIPRGSCESPYKDYGVDYSCNLTKRFYSTCVALYSCLGQKTSKICVQ